MPALVYKINRSILSKLDVDDNYSSPLGDKNGALSWNLNQMTPKMSLLNEKIARLINDIQNIRLEKRRISSDKRISNRLKEIRINFVN